MDRIIKLIILFTILISTNVHSSVTAVAFSKVVPTSTGVSTVLKVFGAANDTVYTKVVNIGKQSLGSAIKSRVFSPWGLALTASLIALDYAIDDNNNEITQTLPASTQVGHCTFFGDDITISLCHSQYNNQQIPSGYAPLGVTQLDAHTYHFNSLAYPGFNFGQWFTSPTVPDLGPTPQGATLPLTDNEISDIVIPLLSQNQLIDLLIDPATSQPDLQISEVQDSVNDLAIEDALINDADPLNDPLTLTPKANLQTEQLQNELSTNSPNEVASTNSNTDICIDNPNSTACLDVGALPTTGQVTEMDLPFDVQLFSLSSNNVCPAPISVPLTVLANYGVNTNLDISYQPYCDFAVTLSPIIIASGLLVAFYVVGGSLRGTA